MPVSPRARQPAEAAASEDRAPLIAAARDGREAETRAPPLSFETSPSKAAGTPGKRDRRPFEGDATLVRRTVVAGVVLVVLALFTVLLKPGNRAAQCRRFVPEVRSLFWSFTDTPADVRTSVEPISPRNGGLGELRWLPNRSAPLAATMALRSSSLASTHLQHMINSFKDIKSALPGDGESAPRPLAPATAPMQSSSLESPSTPLVAAKAPLRMFHRAWVTVTCGGTRRAADLTRRQAPSRCQAPAVLQAAVVITPAA